MGAGFAPAPSRGDSMNQLRSIVAAAACACAALPALAADSIALVYNGIATPNTRAAPATAAFAAWCAATSTAGCIPDGAADGLRRGQRQSPGHRFRVGRDAV